MAVSIPSAGHSKPAGLIAAMMEGTAAPSITSQECQDQRDIGRAGDEKPDGERQLGAFREGLKAGSHGENHPAILAVKSRDFFFPGFTAR
jgi:hypothetical protein